MAIKSHNMAIKSHNMAIKSHNMAIKSHNMAIKSHNMAIKSHNKPFQHLRNLDTETRRLRYLNLDDCWAKSRKDDGTLVADQARW